MNDIKSGTAGQLFILDGGSGLFNKVPVPAFSEKQARITARAIAASYEAMGYDAIGVGPYDLAAGLDFIRDLDRGDRLNWLSANLVSASDGRPVFSPYVIIERGGVKLAAVGLTGTIGALGPILKDQYRILPWHEALPGVIAEIKKKNPDLIVILTSAAKTDYQEMSRAFPEIRLIIEATPNAGNIDPKVVDNLLKCQISPRGKYLARLDVSGTASGPWLEDLTARKQYLLRRLDSLNWRLNRLRKKTDPDRAYIASLEKQKQDVLRSLKEVEAGSRDRSAGMSWKGHFFAIETSTRDEPAVLKIIGESKSALLNLKKELAEKKNAVEKARKKIFELGYTGWPTCGRCHQAQFTTWHRSRHSRSYETLVEKNENANLKCVPCHVTGVKDGSEPFALVLPSTLQQVGCEACHGPGQMHVADPVGTRPDKKAATTACGRCHTPEHDDDFRLKRDVARLNCSEAQK